MLPLNMIDSKLPQLKNIFPALDKWVTFSGITIDFKFYILAKHISPKLVILGVISISDKDEPLK